MEQNVPDANESHLTKTIAYVDKVRRTFKSQPQVFETFLHTVQEFKLQRLDTPGLVHCVVNLFKGHPELIVGFNSFLPRGVKIAMTAGQVEVSLSMPPEFVFRSDGPSATLSSNVPLCSMATTPPSSPVTSPVASKNAALTALNLDAAASPDLDEATATGTKSINTSADQLSTDNLAAVHRAAINYGHGAIVKNPQLRSIAKSTHSEQNSGGVSGFQATKRAGSNRQPFESISDQKRPKMTSLEDVSMAEVGKCGRERERINAEVTEIDYATCKRFGTSYRALPKNHPQPKCSGRTPLCREVLNDTCVVFPSEPEKSTFAAPKKNHHEERIFKCEDERYETDLSIASNLSTIRVFEAVLKRLDLMTQDELIKFKLDDNLGGTSAIHQGSVRRLYGDRAAEIIHGLKKDPALAVPMVLDRLKQKDKEWREYRNSCTEDWREQIERSYLKSLDHQAIPFKQNDVKKLRSKSLLNEIETLFEDRHEQQSTLTGPHITMTYDDKSMVEEACNLIIHHVKRQTSLHKKDKQKIKQLMRHFLPDLFCVPRRELSDDELEDMDIDHDAPSRTFKVITNSSATPSHLAAAEATFASKGPATSSNAATKIKEDTVEDTYALFFVNNHWYIFLRLHAILCERLGRMYERARIIAMEKHCDEESAAAALRLAPKPKIPKNAEKYFPFFVDMIKQVLDGNMNCTKYEDLLREMFGIHAHIAFTMDKVVQSIVRQLQHIVCDVACFQCTDLFVAESKATDGLATGGLVSTQHLRVNSELAYQKKAEQILADENCFKIMFLKRERKVTIELFDIDSLENEDVPEMTHKKRDTLNSNFNENSLIDVA